MSLYTNSEIEKLIEIYNKKENSFIYTLNEGTLGYGDLILMADGCKVCIIKEKYLNEWSSAHSVRFYHKLPKKYAKLI